MNKFTFWRLFIAGGFVCGNCHVIIDLNTVGYARLCGSCKVKADEPSAEDMSYLF